MLDRRLDCLRQNYPPRACRAHSPHSRAAGHGGAAVHQLQLRVEDKAYIHLRDNAHRTLLRGLHAGTAERHVKSTQLVQLHLVTVGKVALNLLYQGFDDVLYVALSS